MGRPSDYSAGLADAICERLIEGESLRSICRSEDMPNASTVCRWLAAHVEFREQYAHAREAQADTLFDETLHIADNQERGEVRTKKLNGDIEVREADMIDHRRLKIETRKWVAGKLSPKKYGDKSALELTGKDGAPLVPVLNVNLSGD